MTLRAVAAAVVLWICTVLLPAADPQLLSLVMPDVKAIAGINVDQARNSQFGQFVLSQMPSNDEGLQEFTKATGFDPRSDLHEVIFASTGEGGKKNGIVLIRGRFDVRRVLSTALSSGKSRSQKYQGVEILANPKQSEGVAFLDNTTAIAGDLTNV